MSLILNTSLDSNSNGVSSYPSLEIIPATVPLSNKIISFPLV